MQTDYERHSLSNPFGEADQADFDELVLSMRNRGYDENHPIVLFESQILDGWHRYLAAKRLGIEPKFREFVGSLEQARTFVYGENLPRRHMNLRQKITALLLMNQWQHPRERLSEAAIQARVGARSSKFTQQMRRVVEKDPDSAHKVVSGEIKANAVIRDVLDETPEGVNDGPIYDEAGTKTEWTITLRKRHLVKEADQLRRQLKMSQQQFVNQAAELFIQWAREQEKTGQ
jgi:hypothetical protein